MRDQRRKVACLRRSSNLQLADVWFEVSILANDDVVVLQDEGSETEVKVDGQPISKGEQKKLKVGSQIEFGNAAVYQV